MRGFRMLYRGPGAWLIWLNLVISCSVLIPFLSEGVIRFILTSGIRFGDWWHIAVLIALLPLAGVAAAGYVLCVPFLLGVCILLAAPKIPWRVKLPVAVLELGAGALLFWDIGRVTEGFKNFHL